MANPVQLSSHEEFHKQIALFRNQSINMYNDIWHSQFWKAIFEPITIKSVHDCGFSIRDPVGFCSNEITGRSGNKTDRNYTGLKGVRSINPGSVGNHSV